MVAGGSLSASQRQVNDVTLQVPTFRHTDSGGPSVDGDRSQQVDPKSLNTISEGKNSLRHVFLPVLRTSMFSFP